MEMILFLCFAVPFAIVLGCGAAIVLGQWLWNVVIGKEPPKP